MSEQIVRRWLDIVRLGPGDVPSWLSDSLDVLRPLLLFAEAADSNPRVFRSIGALLEQRWERMHLSVPSCVQPAEEGAAEQPATVQLQLKEGSLFYFSTIQAQNQEQLMCAFVDGSYRFLLTVRGAPDWRQRFRAAAVAAVEGWLHLACRLQLLPLVRRLMRFAQAQQLAGNATLLGADVSNLLSPRVIECMPRELLLELLYQGYAAGATAAVELKADKAQVTFTTPLAAVWFVKCVGESAELPIKEVGEGDLRLDCEGVQLRSTLRVGVLDPSGMEGAAAIRQAVERCLAEE